MGRVPPRPHLWVLLPAGPRGRSAARTAEVPAEPGARAEAGRVRGARHTAGAQVSGRAATCRGDTGRGGRGGPLGARALRRAPARTPSPGCPRALAGLRLDPQQFGDELHSHQDARVQDSVTRPTRSSVDVAVLVPSNDRSLEAKPPPTRLTLPRGQPRPRFSGSRLQCLPRGVAPSPHSAPSFTRGPGRG